jgi:hypothetical protein
MSIHPRSVDDKAGKAAVAGRVALLLAAFACAAAASLADGAASLVLIMAAVATACAAAFRPLTIRLGRALKPVASASARKQQ